MNRRDALLGMLSASVAPPAMAATSSADATLIKACGELVALRDQIGRLCDARTTLAIEAATEPQMTILAAQEAHILDRVETAGLPTTFLGAAAMAKAALTFAPLADCDGEIVCTDPYDWMLVTVAEFVAAQSYG
jgi:hypothetical protein